MQRVWQTWDGSLMREVPADVPPPVRGATSEESAKGRVDLSQVQREEKGRIRYAFFTLIPKRPYLIRLLVQMRVMGEFRFASGAALRRPVIKFMGS